MMKPHDCERELLVIQAARSGVWDSALRAHVADCESCADAALAAQALNAMRVADELEPRIPDAGLMWWKAQLLSKRAAAERATRPIRFVEHLAYACGGFVFVMICIWRWAMIRGWFASWMTGASKHETAAASAQRIDLQSLWHATLSWIQDVASPQGPSLAIVLSVGALLIFVGFAVYFTRSEE